MGEGSGHIAVGYERCMVLLSKQQRVALLAGWVPVLHEGEEVNPFFSLVLCLEVFDYF